MIAPTMSDSSTARTEMIALPVVISRNIVCQREGSAGSVGTGGAVGTEPPGVWGSGAFT